MEIQLQVCTLDQSNQLIELGINKDSVFYKHPDWNNPKTDSELYDIYGIEFKQTSIPLFTVSELGAMLDNYVDKIKKHHLGYLISLEHKTTDPERRNKGTGTTLYEELYDKEAKARAALLIYLLQNGLTTADTCNALLMPHKQTQN